MAANVPRKISPGAMGIHARLQALLEEEAYPAKPEHAPGRSPTPRTRQSIQVHSGLGLCAGTPLPRMWARARAMRIFADAL
jgi:hypothetical protein